MDAHDDRSGRSFAVGRDQRIAEGHGLAQARRALRLVEGRRHVRIDRKVRIRPPASRSVTRSAWRSDGGVYLEQDAADRLVLPLVGRTEDDGHSCHGRHGRGSDA